MWSPVKLNDGTTFQYGFGWGLRKTVGSRTVEHGGAWQGFKSFITRYLDEKTTIIVFVNAGHASIDKLAQGIGKTYNSEFAPIKAEPIEDKEPKVNEFAKNTLQKAIDGTIEKELFNIQAQKELYPKILAMSPNLKSLGKVIKLELLEKNDLGEARQYKYRAIFENSTLIYFLVLDKEGKIKGALLQPE